MPSEFHSFIKTKLDIRESEGRLRSLKVYNDLIDFSSNDYLGIAVFKIYQLDFCLLRCQQI